MTTPTFPHRGEIWLVSFDPTRGAEIQKTRPAVVMNVESAGRLPLKIVVPVTDWKPYFTELFWLIHLTPDDANGLSKESAADAFQVKSLSEERFVRKLGELPPELTAEIAAAIALCVGYNS